MDILVSVDDGNNFNLRERLWAIILIPITMVGFIITGKAKFLAKNKENKQFRGQYGLVLRKWGMA